MKTLKQIVELKKAETPQPSFPIEPDSVNALVPRTKDERRFYDKHVVQKTSDVNGNGDDVFNASKIRAYDRTSSRHGYNTGDDQKVYENVQQSEAINPDNPRDYNKPTWMRLGQRRYSLVAKKAKDPLTLKDVEDRDNESPTTSAGLSKKAKKLGIGEEAMPKLLSQILGEKTLSSAEMKKREEIAQAMERDNPGMDKSKKMAIATATAKRVAEEAEQTDEAMSHQAKTTMKHVKNPTAGEKKAAKDIKPGIKGYRDRIAMLHSADAEGRLKKEEIELDEAASHEQYNMYHAGVRDMLKKLGVQADAHKEVAMAPTNYNQEKGANMHMGHVYTMKNMHRALQDMHDQLQTDVEYAQPPKPMKIKEEKNQFSDLFNDEKSNQLEELYINVDEESKQIIRDMIENKRFDELLEIVDEAYNG